MLPSGGHLVAFLVTIYVLILIPGPSVVFILSRGVALGRRAAVLRSAHAEAPKRVRTIYREGVAIGLTNPKGLLIFSVIVPEFVDRSAGHETLQLLTLGAITVAIALASDLVWAVISGTARQWLGRSPKRLERMSAGGGITMIGLGVALAVTGRRN